MDLPPSFRFTPVPVRAQSNGWTPQRQQRFILALARGAGPSEAAASLGMSRQSVYRLRDRPGADSFAAAWDRALDFARAVQALMRSPAVTTPDTFLVPRIYRGRLIGYAQREDSSGLLHTLRQLERAAGCVERSDEEDLAVLAGFLAGSGR